MKRWTATRTSGSSSGSPAATKSAWPQIELPGLLPDKLAGSSESRAGRVGPVVRLVEGAPSKTAGDPRRGVRLSSLQPNRSKDIKQRRGVRLDKPMLGVQGLCMQLQSRLWLCCPTGQKIRNRLSSPVELTPGCIDNPARSSGSGDRPCWRPSNAGGLTHPWRQRAHS